MVKGTPLAFMRDGNRTLYIFRDNSKVFLRCAMNKQSCTLDEGCLSMAQRGFLTSGDTYKDYLYVFLHDEAIKINRADLSDCSIVNAINGSAYFEESNVEHVSRDGDTSYYIVGGTWKIMSISPRTFKVSITTPSDLALIGKYTTGWDLYKEVQGAMYYVACDSYRKIQVTASGVRDESISLGDIPDDPKPVLSGTAVFTVPARSPPVSESYLVDPFEDMRGNPNPGGRSKDVSGVIVDLLKTMKNIEVMLLDTLRLGNS